MPNVRIEVRRQWPAGHKQAIKNAVHAAMVEAIRIPEHDRTIRYYEHDPADFDVQAGASENFTLVEITLFSGRSLDAKRALYKAIVAKLGVLGIAPPDIRITLIESPPENWGIRGGQAASDINLGFTIKV